MPSVTRRALMLAGAAGGLATGEIVVATLAGCVARTGAPLLELETRVKSDTAPGSGFVNHHGWHVTVERALLSLDRVEYFAARLAARAPVGAIERVVALLAPPSAHAHPDDDGSDLVGEMTSAPAVDLFQAEPLPPTAAIAGAIGHATLRFAEPPRGPHASELEGHVVVIAGRATRDGDERLFRAAIAAAQLLDHHGLPEVVGCAIEGGPVEGGGSLTLMVSLGVWLADVDFVSVAAPCRDSAGYCALDPLQPALTALVAGIKNASAYRVRYQAG
jgi:hypothetical protein